MVWLPSDFWGSFGSARAKDGKMRFAISSPFRSVFVQVVGRWLWLPLLLACGTAAVVGVPPVRLGVLPYSSAFNPLAIRQPLCRYLEKKLGCPVQFYTASNHAAFVRDSDAGDYDLLLTAPHMGRLAQLKAGYVPLLQYAGNLQLFLVGAQGGAVRDIADLRGKTIAFPDRLALATMRGKRWLKSHGLTQGQDYRLLETPSHANAILALSRRDSQAALTSRAFFAQLPEKTKSGFRVVAVSGQGPHLMFLANPRLSPGMIHQIQTVLITFANTSPEGKLFRTAGQTGLEMVRENDLKRMDPYARELSALLEARQ